MTEPTMKEFLNFCVRANGGEYEWFVDVCRKILEDDNLDEETRAAQKEEMERRKRLQEIQEKLRQQAAELRAQREREMMETLEQLKNSALKSLLDGNVLLFHIYLSPCVGPGHPSSPFPIYFIFSPLLFPFFHWLYLFSSFVYPFPFYQNSPTPFPGRRS